MNVDNALVILAAALNLGHRPGQCAAIETAVAVLLGEDERGHGDMSTFHPGIPEVALPYVVLTYLHAIEDNDTATATALARLHTAFGPDCVHAAYDLWIDITFEVVGIARGVIPAWDAVETESPDDIAMLSPTVRWVGQLIAAQAADDADTYHDMMRDAPTAPEEVWERTSVLLATLGTMVRRTFLDTGSGERRTVVTVEQVHAELQRRGL
jgi:hypothetical protein